jgi:metal-responsive CopG/Arc/MetJ family transcriptional regulator
MKADISIPNPILEAAERLAQRLGMTRSEFYSAALSAYLAIHQSRETTEDLDRVYETEPSSLDPELVQIQVASM